MTMIDGWGRQKAAWTWGAVFAVVVAGAPVMIARTGGGWIAPVLALPGLLATERLLTPIETGGLARGFCDVLGKEFGRALTFIYITWAMALGGTQLWTGVRRVHRAVVLGGSEWMLAVGVILLAIWLVRGKVFFCAQWAMLALNGLLVVLGAIALLTLMQARWDEIVPPWRGGALAGAVGATFGVMCVRVYGGFLQGEAIWRGKRYAVMGCVLLSLLFLAVQGNLGTELAARLEDPLLTLSRNVGVEGTFRRAESALASALVLADLVLLTLMLWASKSAVEQAWQVRNLGRFTAAIAVGVLGIAVLPVTQRQMQVFRQNVVPWVNLVLGLVIPGGLMLVGRLKRRHILCQRAKETAHIERLKKL